MCFKFNFLYRSRSWLWFKIIKKTYKEKPTIQTQIRIKKHFLKLRVLHLHVRPIEWKADASTSISSSSSIFVISEGRLFTFCGNINDIFKIFVLPLFLHQNVAKLIICIPRELLHVPVWLLKHLFFISSHMVHRTAPLTFSIVILS